MAPYVPVFSWTLFEDRCVEVSWLIASIHVVDHVRTGQGATGDVVDGGWWKVPNSSYVLGPVPSRARLHPTHSQSLTTRLMGGAGGNDSSENRTRQPPATTRAPFHEHFMSSTVTTTGGKDSRPMESDESQPQEGWMVRTPPAPSVL